MTRLTHCRIGKGLSRKRRARIIACAALDLVYAAAIATIWSCNASGPEQWRWIALNLYIPQWLWLIPGAVLILLTSLVAWRWSWIPVLPMLCVAGPLMDFHWSFGSGSPPTGATRIRVMTWNVDGRLARERIGAEVLTGDPDVLMLQEASPRPWSGETKAALSGYRVYGPEGGLLIACRLPVKQFDTLHVPQAAGVDVILRCKATVDGRQVSFYTVHLPTPRWGLEPLMERGTGATLTWQQSINARLWDVTAVSALLVGDTGPRIVAGDLNAPQCSQVTGRMMRGGLVDAFVEGGKGYGYTYGHELAVGHSYVRIDHILTSRDWVVEQCRTGGAAASDHRPVIADIYLGRKR